MARSQEELSQLLQNPRESLETEIKQWIDPATDDGIGKIARACIALRNNNGGCLVIGIQDDGQPDPAVPNNVREMFHPDIIQGIVGRYSSQQFEVLVEFVSRDGLEYPVICVPGGSQVPVAAKADLKSNDPGKPYVRCNTVYVRTLNSNNTVSSSQARWNDWPDIARHCFNNREADIGSFVRRHLAGIDLGGFLAGLTPQPPTPTLNDRTIEFLTTGLNRARAALAQRKQPIGEFGSFEVAIVIDGQLPPRIADDRFYWMLQASRPRLTGWDFWLDTGRGSKDEFAPYVFNGGWEVAIATKIFNWHIDFWRAEPSGQFYHFRVLEDDLVAGYEIEPRKVLDYAIWIHRVTETLLLASHFAYTLVGSDTPCGIGVACRWTGLAGRHLYSWSEPRRHFWSAGAAVQDSVTTSVVMPMDTAPLALIPFVESLTAPLFAVFGGERFETVVTEQIVRELVNR